MWRQRFLAFAVVTILLLTSTLVSLAFSASLEQKYIHVNARCETSRSTPNIITNGGFEASPVPSMGNWQVITSDSSHAGIISQSTDAYSGSYSGLFTITSNPSIGGFFALSESTFFWGIGLTYQLTFYYKSSLSSSNAWVFCKSEPTTTGYDLAYWVSNNMPPTNTWTQVTMTFGPVPQGTVDLQIHFGSPEGVTGTLQIDDVSTVFATPQPPAPPPITTLVPTQNPTAAPTTNPTQIPILPTPSLTFNSPINPDTVNPTPVEATSTPTPTADATAAPTDISTPTPSPTINPTTQPSSPPIPEVTPLIIALALGLVTGIALTGRKQLSKSKLSVANAAKVLAALLLFTSMANLVNGQTVSPTPTSTPMINFSLWYTNGTALPTDGKNVAGLVNGGYAINVGGIYCSPMGYGSSGSPSMTNVVVLRNDGNVPFNISLALKNVVAPSNIQVVLGYYAMSPQAWSPYSDHWLGNGNVATGNPIAPGKYYWLGITALLAQTNVPMSGTPNYSFDYSFDIQVQAITSQT